MAGSLLANGSVFNSMNSRAESPSVSTLYYWDETDGKANGIEIKLLSLGFIPNCITFYCLMIGCRGGKSLIFSSCKTPKYEEWEGILLHSSGHRRGAVHLRRCLTSLMSSQPLLKQEPFFFSECDYAETENYVSNSDKPGSAAKWIGTFTHSYSLSHTILKWLIFHQSSTLNLIAGNFKIK